MRLFLGIFRFALLGLISLSLSACASARRTAPSTKAVSATGPASLPLDQIEPVPTLAASLTRPANLDEPPLEAVLLYARARVEILDDRRFMAMAMLEKAIALDPYSYALRYELGKVFRTGVAFEPRAVEQFEKAAELEPDHIDIQLDLGRQYLAKGEMPEALRRFRLAVQTHEYKASDDRASEADFLLAHALRELGYDRAALDRFERLLVRLETGDFSPGYEASTQLTTRLYLSVGDLYLKYERPVDALAAYRKAEGAPGSASDVEVQSRMVRALLVANRVDEGLDRALETVQQSRASGASVKLLREAYQAIGNPTGAASALAKLHQQRPAEPALLFALSDVLVADGKSDAAETRLAEAWRKSPGSPALLHRRFVLRHQAGDIPGAVRLLIAALANYPDLAGQMDALYDRLLTAGSRRRFTPRELDRLSVPPDQESARAFVQWKLATLWPRQTIATAALDKALQSRPVFAPAYRARLAQILNEPRLGDVAAGRLAGALIQSVEQAGDSTLAAELESRLALWRKDASKALALLTDSSAANVSSPDRQLLLAESLRAFGEQSTYDGHAWRALSAFPAFNELYVSLYADYQRRGDAAQAEKVLSAWKLAQPAGEPPMPQLVSRLAQEQLAKGRPEAAELILADLERENPADPELLKTLYMIHQQANRLDRLAARLEERLGDGSQLGPWGMHSVGTMLAKIYLVQGRSSDAARVLDLARATLGDEPDLLYSLAELYDKANAPDLVEQVLKQALEIDPLHLPAANDLAYLWAERNTHLDEAERLIRATFSRDPQRPGLLDTLGWVLYKRGKFEEARAALQQALDATPLTTTTTTLPATGPTADQDAAAAKEPKTDPPKRDHADPITLDHMGDLLYRLGDRNGAAQWWERARRRLANEDQASADRAAHQSLRLTLPLKLQQLQAGKDVQTTP